MRNLTADFTHAFGVSNAFKLAARVASVIHARTTLQTQEKVERSHARMTQMQGKIRDSGVHDIKRSNKGFLARFEV